MKKKIYSAFTLAEMMVVMLILSIVMAAFAPVMTTRSKTERTSPWRYATNNSDIYFGLGDNQTAMIGQPAKVNGTDPSSRLIINTYDDNQKHIVFKRGQDNLLGSLQMGSNSLLLGNLKSGNLSKFNTLIGTELTIPVDGQNNVMLGSRLTTKGNGSVTIGSESDTQGAGSIAIGIRAGASTSSSNGIVLGSELEIDGENSIAIGQDTGANYEVVGNNSILLGKGNITGQKSVGIGNGTSVTTSYSVALGADSSAENTYATAVGYGAKASGGSSTAIGYNSKVTAASSIAAGNSSKAEGSWASAYGYGAKALKSETVAVGDVAEASEYAAVAMGYNAKGQGANSVSIGYNSKATNTDAVALGSNVTASGESSIAIGSHETNDDTTASGDGGVAIGDGAVASGKYGVAIGSSAKARGEFNTAIGQGACLNVTGSNKTCIGANSGPDTNDSLASNSSGAVYIGTTNTTVYIPGDLIVGKAALFGARSINDNNNYKVFLRAGNKGHNSDWVYLGTDDYKGGDDNFYRLDNFTVGNYSFSRWASFPSDRRLKYVGKENTSGLDKIKQLKVFNYTFKKDEKKMPHVGVIAQDLQKVFPDAVTKNKAGFLTIRMEDMFYALINAVKELALKMDKNEQKIIQLEKENKELKARLEKLEAKIK